MPDTAIAKIEDALAAALRAWGPLATVVVKTEQSVDQASDGENAQELAIYTVQTSFDQADEQDQTLHTMIVELEITSRGPSLGGLGRANLEVLANVVGAIAADRMLGGRLHDMQENDIARAATNGKDVSSASLQVRIQFFTSRSDWFTILGQGGQTF